MRIQDSTRELAELDFYAGDLSTAEDFTELYERMLNQVKAIEDKQERETNAKAMQRILLRQVEFLMNQWLSEKQKTMPLYVKGYGFGALN